MSLSIHRRMEVKILKIIFLFVKDVYKIGKLTRCDFFDIMEIVGFGLVVNSLYGVLKEKDIFDIYLLITSLYGTLKMKHFKKDKLC